MVRAKTVSRASMGFCFDGIFPKPSFSFHGLEKIGSEVHLKRCIVLRVAEYSLYNVTSVTCSDGLVRLHPTTALAWCWYTHVAWSVRLAAAYSGNEKHRPATEGTSKQEGNVEMLSPPYMPQRALKSHRGCAIGFAELFFLDK